MSARIAILLAGVGVLVGCGAKSGLLSSSPEADADADTDADTDADADTDSDTDTDADADVDPPPPDCGVEYCDDSQFCCVAERCVQVGGCCADEECPDGMSCRIASETCGVDDMGCGIETLDVRPVAPNFMILLDRSGSMAAFIDGRSKWEIAIGALADVLPAYEIDVRFGLMMFPGPQASCDPGIIDVEVGDQHADEVIAVLESSEPLLTTPMASSLDELGEYEGLQDDDRRNLVLLVTDGEESCNGEPVTETQHLYDDDIQVYVVGFGSEVDDESLSEIAEAGRTDRPGNPSYYQAEDADELAGALDDIVASVIPCAFDLNGEPPLPDDIFVFFDGASGVRRDFDHADGWDYDEDTNVLTFYGAACDQVKTDQHVVQVVFGCPDDDR